MVGAVDVELGGDGAGDDVAGLELVDEALAGGVAEQGAVTPQRLGQERPGHGRVVQGGGMELDELDIGDRRADPQGHRHAVTGGLHRVGGHRVELATAARGQQHVPGPHLEALTVLVEGHHARAPAPVDQEVERERALEQHRRRLAHRHHQRPLDLDPSGGTAGVEDPGVAVAPLPGEEVLALLVLVEHRPHGDELVDPGRALVDQDPDRVEVAEAGAGGERVGQVEVGGVGIAAEHGGHAALRPTSRGLGQLALGEHADLHAVHVGGPHGGGEAGDAGTEHEQIERVHPASLPHPSRNWTRLRTTPVPKLDAPPYHPRSETGRASVPPDAGVPATLQR